MTISSSLHVPLRPITLPFPFSLGRAALSVPRVQQEQLGDSLSVLLPTPTLKLTCNWAYACSLLLCSFSLATSGRGSWIGGEFRGLPLVAPSLLLDCFIRAAFLDCALSSCHRGLCGLQFYFVFDGNSDTPPFSLGNLSSFVPDAAGPSLRLAVKSSEFPAPNLSPRRGPGESYSMSYIFFCRR